MRCDVKRYVDSCDVFQCVKYSTAPASGLLQPLPVPSHVWEDLTMDFIVGLPLAKGLSAILVVVDRLSKYAHFGALPSQFTAEHAAALFSEIVLTLHGFPFFDYLGSRSDLHERLLEDIVQDQWHYFEELDGLSPPNRWTDGGLEPLPRTISPPFLP